MQRPAQEVQSDVFLLVEKIKNGDREAFVTLTRRYQRKVFALAYSFFGNTEDALDIVQETFLRLYQKVHMFKKGRNFQSWLLQIAKNICIDVYRKQHRKNQPPEFERQRVEMDPVDAESSDGYSRQDLQRIFSSCLQKLTDKQRMVFLMKHTNELKYSEIAQILEIAPGTVKSLHFKAVQNMRALAGPYLGRLR